MCGFKGSHVITIEFTQGTVKLLEFKNGHIVSLPHCLDMVCFHFSISILQYTSVPKKILD